MSNPQRNIRARRRRQRRQRAWDARRERLRSSRMDMMKAQRTHNMLVSAMQAAAADPENQRKVIEAGIADMKRQGLFRDLSSGPEDEAVKEIVSVSERIVTKDTLVNELNKLFPPPPDLQDPPP